MDLRNLLRGGAGAAGGSTKQKNVAELRQGLYKKSGTKSSSEHRTLRTIQANQKRNLSRASKINAGRGITVDDNINDENRNVNVGAATNGRLSRRDRLEEYRKEKKAAIERNRKKNVVPFRCGKVQHPVDSLAALPPVPNTKNSAPGRNSTVKIVTEKRIPLRASRAATAASKPQSAISTKTPALKSSKTPKSSTRTPAVKSSTTKGKAKKESQVKVGATPKQTGKSFAPKNFQFNMNLPMPVVPTLTTKGEGTVEKETKEHVKEVVTKSIDPTTPEQAPAPRRRSRRISGVQPDPSLTPAQLSLTPARRAKERSVSRDRRKTQGCGMCPDINCTKTDASHEDLRQEDTRRSTRRSLKADIDNDSTTYVNDENVNKTPDLKELLQAAAVIPSTVKRRRTRMSAMKAIEESAQEADNHEEVLTPVSNIISKIKDTVIQSEKKEEGFKTPKSTRTKKQELSDEPMRVMSPLSSVSTVRGSSKRKRTSPEAKNSIFNMFDNLEGSPILAKLEAKLKTNEEITEDDFVNETNAPAAKQLKLSNDFDEIANNEGVGQEETPTKENEHDVPYFRNLLKTETQRLTSICEAWETTLEKNLYLISDDIQGEIRSVIGQGKLVMAERFHQFSGLVDNCEFKRGEKETTCMDLMGFWEMIYFQVEDVDKKFDKLKEIENNNWKEVVTKPAGPLKKKVVKKPSGTGVSKAGPSSGLKAMIAAKRKAAMAQNKPEEDVVVKKTPKGKTRKSVQKVEEDNQFDGGFFKITSPARTTPVQSPNQKTPGSGKSGKQETPVRRSVGDHLRRSVLQDNTKRRSGLLLSPFISQAARRSLPGPVSPYRSNTPSPLVETTIKKVSPLINIVDPVVPLSSPVTKTYSRRGSSSAAKQRENDAFDMMATGSNTTPKIDESYLKPSVHDNDMELISFASPVLKKTSDDSTPRTRRSSRVKTPLLK